MSQDPFRKQYLDDMIERFRAVKSLGERALDQIDDQDLFARLDPDSTTLAEIVKHIGGNLRSRFTDFLTADGEKPDRHRDGEFEITKEDSAASLTASWELGWGRLFEALEALTPADLDRTVNIRSEPHSIAKALSRSLSHISYHVGQIVWLARHLKGGDFQSLSIPRGGSDEFNRRMQGGAAKSPR